MRWMVLAMMLVAGVADVSFAQYHSHECKVARESCQHIQDLKTDLIKEHADIFRRVREECNENLKNRFPNEEAQRQAFLDSCEGASCWLDVYKKHPSTSEEKNFLRFCYGRKGFSFDDPFADPPTVDGLDEAYNDCACAFGCRHPDLFCY